MIDDDCTAGENLVLIQDPNEAYAQWRIKACGAIENEHCKDLVFDIANLSSEAGSPVFLSDSKEDDGGWSQQWSIRSKSVIIMEAPSGDDQAVDAGKNSNQTFSPFFIDPGYEVGILPGFPGSYETVEEQSCLSSARDLDLAKRAMYTCDESMSLLVGSQMVSKILCSVLLLYFAILRHIFIFVMK